MIAPHEHAFRYRPHLLVVAVLAAAGALLLEPTTSGYGYVASIAILAVVVGLSYVVMFIFVRIAVNPLQAQYPSLVRIWALAWFYGAAPVSLIALYVGLSQLHAPPPSAATTALTFAASVGMAAAALSPLRGDRGRLTKIGAGRER